MPSNPLVNRSEVLNAQANQYGHSVRYGSPPSGFIDFACRRHCIDDIVKIEPGQGGFFGVRRYQTIRPHRPKGRCSVALVRAIFSSSASSSGQFGTAVLRLSLARRISGREWLKANWYSASRITALWAWMADLMLLPRRIALEAVNEVESVVPVH